MFRLLGNIRSKFADYTVGSIIVMVHMATAERVNHRELLQS